MKSTMLDRNKKIIKRTNDFFIPLHFQCFGDINHQSRYIETIQSKKRHKKQWPKAARHKQTYQSICASLSRRQLKRSSELHSSQINRNATKKGQKTKNEEPIIHHHLTWYHNWKCLAHLFPSKSKKKKKQTPFTPDDHSDSLHEKSKTQTKQVIW